jgi:hypothetical protein
MIVGFKLLDKNGTVIKSWGGTYGISIDPPSAITLANGDRVHCPALDTPYGPEGDPYQLVAWEMNPPPEVIAPISSRQGKIQLLRMGLMTAEEASAGTPPAFLSSIAEGMDPAEAAELLITWRDAVVWERDNPLFGGSLLAAASAALGQEATPETVDQFFRDAAGIS